MTAFTATAPGKAILFGEHAVVYGRPAIAVPVSQVQARVVVTAEPRRPSGEVRIVAPEIELEASHSELAVDHPLAKAVSLVVEMFGVERMPACSLRITSTIPLAAGLGSGAAVSVATIRALSAFLGHPLPDDRVCSLAYEVEKLHHGTPSGIDNSVVTYGKPVYFVRDRPIQVMNLPAPFTMVIGDTGIRSPTSLSVGDVRVRWQSEPEKYEAIFDRVGEISQSARQLIEGGSPMSVGSLMNENHALLTQMGVSCAELDRLVDAALQAGASGAKLSGSGRGGNMIALATPQDAELIARALERSGAVRTIVTQVRAIR